MWPQRRNMQRIMGSGGRLEHARQMDVQGLSFDLAAAVPEGAGQEFSPLALYRTTEGFRP